MPLYMIRQDITSMKCDAIVNTTNRDMIGYSGVDLAIHAKAGPALDIECRTLVPLELGFAKLTQGYNLACKYIIHTAGPVWKGGGHGERAILKSCYLESLRLAEAFRCQTVAFPLISSGAYGYPKDQVLTYAVEVIVEFLQTSDMTVFLCVFDEQSYEFSRALLYDIQSFISQNHIQIKRHGEISGSALPYIRTRRSLPEPLADACADETVPRIERRAPGHSPKPVPACPVTQPCPAPLADSLDDFLKNMGDGFAETLFALIDEKGMTDVECYKRANVDKKVFSKIKCNKNYKPSKPTAVAFAIALRLTLDETRGLLASAGLALSHSNTFDMIIEYFIIKGNYNIFEINEALFEFDQILLGAT